ncbi:hypothetical protein DPMN_080542 [Dreissena polymorpha]|uniref:Uncharacterized protein n=1 Tax=Dreissena polymorpha TaxID=45954 RepID=A0A9D4BTY0_DREPO|nr:hypothetical protein DPMN_080542 [Dreissena polymorpha]
MQVSPAAHTSCPVAWQFQSGIGDRCYLAALSFSSRGGSNESSPFSIGHRLAKDMGYPSSTPLKEVFFNGRLHLPNALLHIQENA